jgi:uncharacterized protein
MENPMQIIRAAEHVTVPWKNGGGTATDIIASPKGAGFDAFDWRLSGAHVGREGPFSLFPGVERCMLILSGGTLVMQGLPQGEARLGRASEPFVFPGDVQVTATVPDGPIDNLNLMWDRRRFRARVWRASFRTATSVQPKGVLLAYCETGQIIADGATLSQGDTLVTEQAVTLSGPAVILADIMPL